jgi:hypothetical protein
MLNKIIIYSDYLSAVNSMLPHPKTMLSLEDTVSQYNPVLERTTPPPYPKAVLSLEDMVL